MNFNIAHLFLAYVVLCSEFYVFDKTPTFGQTANRVREKFRREKSNNNSERRRSRLAARIHYYYYCYYRYTYIHPIRNYDRTVEKETWQWLNLIMYSIHFITKTIVMVYILYRLILLFKPVTVLLLLPYYLWTKLGWLL